jgi:hypothetical protein
MRLKSTNVSDESAATSSHFYPEDGERTILLNVRTFLPDYTALYPRSRQSSFSIHSGPQILISDV